jgi:hypothetical protein
LRIASDNRSCHSPAGQIAAQQRLEHQHERIFAALDLAGNGVTSNAKGGAKGKDKGLTPNRALRAGAGGITRPAQGRRQAERHVFAGAVKL